MELSFLLPSLILLIPAIFFILAFLYFSNVAYFIRSLPLVFDDSHGSQRHQKLDWVVQLLAAGSRPTVTIGPVVFTADPSNVEHVSKSHFHNYPRASFVVSALHNFLGDGIFNARGEQWRLQRKTASYAFSTGSLRSFVLDRLGREVHDRLLPALKSASEEEQVLDLQQLLERFAFNNISGVALGHDPNCLLGNDEKGLYQAFRLVGLASLERSELPFSIIWRLRKLLNIGSERRLRESMAIINEFLPQRFAQARNSADQEPVSFLSKFADDESHPEKFFSELLLSLMVAGRDTTPSALTWFFWLVSSRRDVVRKIQEEVKSSRARSEAASKSFTLDSLRQMNYLHAAISESMRLYPPVPLVMRECKAAETLADGTAVKRGWVVIYSPMAMGRSKKIWGEDCEEFRPERWLREDGTFRGRSPFEYPVFHAGPGVCLGKDMAMIQMKAVAASVLERFEVEAAEGRGELEPLLTLMMKGGLPVRVTEISK